MRRKIDIPKTLKSLLEKPSIRVEIWKTENLTKYELLKSYIKISLSCILNKSQK